MPETKPILFTPAQYDLLQMGLTILMQASKQQVKDSDGKNMEAQQMHNAAASLSSNLASNVMHGTGMTPEKMQEFEQRMSAAHQKNDQIGVMRTLRDLIATLARVEPDPAKSIADITMRAIMRANSAQAGDVFIPIMRKKIAGLKTDYENEGFPSAQEVLVYLDAWLDFGHTNLKNGEEAWAGDPHLTGKRS